MSDRWQYRCSCGRVGEGSEWLVRHAGYAHLETNPAHVWSVWPRGNKTSVVKIEAVEGQMTLDEAFKAFGVCDE